MKKTCLTMSVLLVACTGYVQPKQSVAQTDAAIRGAQQSGAESVQPAAEHLALAVDQNNEAKTKMARGEYFDAYYLSRRAEADAELAEALANERNIDQRVAHERATSGRALPGY